MSLGGEFLDFRPSAISLSLSLARPSLELSQLETFLLAHPPFLPAYLPARLPFLHLVSSIGWRVYNPKR